MSFKCIHCGAEPMRTGHKCPTAHGEVVNHPQHYGGDTTYEVIKVIEAWKLGFCLGNVLKYIGRAGKKAIAVELEDLKKAKWYLERRITQLSAASARSEESDRP